MPRKLQNGIFYNNIIFPFKNSSRNYKDTYNNTFAILFLKIRKKSNRDHIVQSLEKLWKMYENLRKGIIVDLPNQRVPHGSLSVTLGYGQNIFKLNDITKSIPRDFNNSQFLSPKKHGGYILEGSHLSYSKDIHENVGVNEDIVIQFIANSQLAVNRAIVETWKNLRHNSLSKPSSSLIFSKFFTGFQRDDGRSWLGFHDGVSNMRPGKERRNVIAIHRENNELLPRDFWTEHGTYMAFLRIEIDLDLWDSIKRSKQELIIGREKLYGRPLIGVDKYNNPITSKKFPTAQKVTAFSKRYHDHPDYFKVPQLSTDLMRKIDIDKSFKALNESHIGRARHYDKINNKLVPSRRIYRQAFEFIESNYLYNKFIKIGLNFLSFQNDPARLLFILTDPNWLGNSSFGGDSQFKGIGELLHVQACGIFYIPPIEQPFPGSSIFR